MTDRQSAGSAGDTDAVEWHFSRFWLHLARIVWLAVVVPSLVLFVVGLPLYYQQLQTPCADPLHCSLAFALTAAGLRALAALGISATAYAAFVTAFWVVIVAIWSGVGFLIFSRRSDDGMALLASFALVIFNSTFPGLATTVLAMTYPVLNLPFMLLGVLGQITITLLFLLFPSGRLIPRWTGVVIPLVVVQAVGLVAPPTSPLNANSWPGWLNGLLALTIYGTILFSQVYRYRRVSTPVQRQQTKWVVFGIITVVSGFIVFGLLFNGLFPALTQPDTPYSLIQIVYPLLLLVLPVSVGIAILRYRLWDIDLIINRTLVYSALTACVVGIYVLVVGYLGAVFHSNGDVIISLVATGLVAVLFQPLRDLLQRSINRLVYGLRDEPYAVLAGLGQRLQATLDPGAVLSTIVATVREALKLSYAAIEVQEGAAVVLAAAAGTPPAKAALRVPLVYQSELVGTLLLAPRERDDTLTPADLRLVDDLTHQIGSAVHTVRLTSDLRALTRDLQRSREHLVTAREEERRRLRRDLHDGLGPMLSAILLKVGLVRTLHRRDPETTDAHLNQLEAEIESVIGDIRRVVYNLRPPALDELGLVGAIREYVARLGPGAQAHDAALTVTVEAPENLPTLPAAVEVAAYRIVQEAMTNVVRHAQAQSCQVRFVADETLRIEIRDDGKGFAEADIAGVGLTSMRERAEELGGTFMIGRVASGGTQITACLPLSDGTRARARQ